ncbi:MAG: lactate permease [SAR202 cluster bacterium Io17-Chloro-G3]|nr:MAG: lactate permease [SAR202 cluster bacterium Io17-Chloro-G3]
MDQSGPSLNLLNGLLAASPIGVLLVSLLVLRWSAPKAGALSWLVVAVIAFVYFGADARIIAIASAKGLSLSFFVLTIIWSSVLLYNLIDQLDGIKVIGTTIAHLVGNPLAQALVVGWAFSGFMQGVAGFGVPVAVVAPLLVLMGFQPVKAAAIVLVGHAWAVSFGSLGSSYYTIQLVTGIEGDVIGPHMAILFVVPIIMTGFAVAHLEGGLMAVRRGALGILIMGGVMAMSVWLLASLGAAQIASLVPGLVGCGVGWLLARTSLLGKAVERDARIKVTAVELQSLSENKLGFHLAFLPYYLLILLSILSQLPVVKDISANWYWGLDYPAMETALGFVTESKGDYGKIRFLRHPAPLILLSLAASSVTLLAIGKWRDRALISALKQTYVQSISTSVGIGTMVMMALVMTDTGMTTLLGQAIAAGTGDAFPLFSPYIGLLGTFMTGSNTNSNIMFGSLQLETATSLNISAVTIASIQSIGGSLGSSIAPAKVLVGTAIVGLSGRESEVLRRTIPYCLAIVFLVGLQAWLLIYVF